MGKLLDSLNDYFENTPQEVLDSDFKEMAHLNDIGPDAIEYAESVKKHFADKSIVPQAESKTNVSSHRLRWAGIS